MNSEEPLKNIESLALKAKEMIFAQEYLVTLDPEAAALKAGYSKTVARTKAYQWLAKVSRNYKPHVHAYVLSLISNRVTKLERTGEEVISMLWEIVDRCMQKKPVLVYDKDVKGMVQATTIMSDTVKEQLVEVGVWTFDSRGANVALGLLGKHYGVIKEKVEVDLTSHDESVKRIREKIALRKSEQK